MLTVGIKSPTTRWLDSNTWSCDRHVPSAKFPARLEECCYYGCTSRRPPLSDEAPVPPGLAAPPPPVAAVFVPPEFEDVTEPVTEPDLAPLPPAEEPEPPEEPITDPELPVVQVAPPPVKPVKRSHKAKVAKPLPKKQKPVDEARSKQQSKSRTMLWEPMAPKSTREQEKFDRDVRDMIRDVKTVAREFWVRVLGRPKQPGD